MKICIPIEFKPQGGGFYFLRSFKAYLTGRGYPVINDLDAAYDILFTNHWMVNRGAILRAVRANPQVRIVQRIDGAACAYGRNDDADRRQREVNRLADLTIFQSEYARRCTREEYPIIEHDGPVIHNPVDTQLFSPDGGRAVFPESVLVACVSWSTNPFKGADSLYQVAHEHPSIGFILCGRYVDAPALPNVHRQGVLGREELARTLRACHALLTFSQNEACPNHVLEALASGLPVLYHDSGAMAEIIGDCGLPVTPGTFLSSLQRILGEREALTQKARLRALTLFNPETIFQKYIHALQNVCSVPLQTPFLQRLLLAWFEPAMLRTKRLFRRSSKQGFRLL